MQDIRWERFAQTGQVCDYLTYKGHLAVNDVNDSMPAIQSKSMEESLKNKYAGFCSINRNGN